MTVTDERREAVADEMFYVTTPEHLYAFGIQSFDDHAVSPPGSRKIDWCFEQSGSLTIREQRYEIDAAWMLRWFADKQVISFYHAHAIELWMIQKVFPDVQLLLNKPVD